MVKQINRFNICLINLDPTVGSEMQKTRPCIVVSPEEMNDSQLKTVIIAPMTTRIREPYPTRVKINFQNKTGQVALDQLRAIDRRRIIKVMGTASQPTQSKLLDILYLMFSE